MHEAVSEIQNKDDCRMHDKKGKYLYELGCRWLCIRWKERVWANDVTCAEIKGWHKRWFSSIETIRRIY